MSIGEPLTVWTIRISLVCLAAVLLGRPADLGREFWSRTLWTLGFLCLLLHVACAFHYFHGWSHLTALEDTARRTAETMGWSFAGGLYFNYVFVAVWGLDVCWWWASPATYLCRSTAWTAAIRGFLLFIAFQATIVFETGSTRWVAVVAFALIAVRFARRRVITEMNGSSQ